MTGSRKILRNARYVCNEAQELLQSIFVSEFISPSKDLWLISPWLSDIVVIDDLHGGFSSLIEGPTDSSLRLTGALVRLAEMGTRVRIVTRPGESPEFHRSLERRLAHSQNGGRLTVTTAETLHTKGLIGDDYCLIGSMNFTNHGVHINEEAINFDRDVEGIAQIRLEVEQQYGR